MTWTTENTSQLSVFVSNGDVIGYYKFLDSTGLRYPILALGVV